MMRTVVLPAVLAFGVSALCLPLVKWIARRFDILDHPSTPLKRHGRAVPYLGGVAIAIGVAAGLTVHPGVMPAELRGLLVGAGVLLLVGLADDIRPLSPHVKLLFQGLATTVMIAGGLHVSIVAFPPAVNYALTYFWVLAITNAFNIIDVHDGLAAGSSILIAAGLIIVSLFTEYYDKTFVTVSAAALAGGGLALFLANHPPATIFLGDAGSLPLGFMLSGLAIGESYTPEHAVGLLVPFLLFVIPIYDLVFVVVIRLLKGLSPIRGSPDHVAIRLRTLGWSDARVLWSLLALGGVAAVLTPGVAFLPLPYASFVAACAMVGAIAVGVMLARIRAP